MGNTQTKLLFVGLDENLVDVLKKHETSKTWYIEFCADSFTAIQKLKNNDYHMVVMDHEIAPLNPFKLMDYITQELKKNMAMTIVGNSAYASDENYASYLKLHFPMGPEDIDKMAEHMGSHTIVQEKPKPFSLNYLKELSDNNQEFIEESLQLFLDTISVKLNELEKSTLDKDYKEAREIAHNVKPTFAMLGNDEGKNICHAICHDADDSQIPPLIEALNRECDEIILEIAKEFPQLNNYEKENLDH